MCARTASANPTALHDIVDRLCPPEQQVSDVCVASWHGAASNAVFCFGAGLAATLILVMCSAVAPEHKKQATLVILVAGAVVAIVLAPMMDAWLEALTAIAVGLLVRSALDRRHIRRDDPDQAASKV